MSKEVDFIIYCIEIYKRDKNLTGKETIKIFTKYQVLAILRNIKRHFIRQVKNILLMTLIYI